MMKSEKSESSVSIVPNTHRIYAVYYIAASDDLMFDRVLYWVVKTVTPDDQRDLPFVDSRALTFNVEIGLDLVDEVSNMLGFWDFGDAAPVVDGPEVRECFAFDIAAKRKDFAARVAKVPAQ